MTRLGPGRMCQTCLWNIRSGWLIRAGIPAYVRYAVILTCDLRADRESLGWSMQIASGELCSTNLPNEYEMIS